MDHKTINLFHSKYEPVTESGCWIWLGATTGKSGYGHLRSGSKDLSAHRASWEIHFGDIPKKTYVLHRCDNKMCVNPNHLFLGHHRDNMMDMVRKGRSNRGDKNGMAKLTAEKVLEIKMLFHHFDDSEIARKFFVAPRTIKDIRGGKSWGHL